MPGDVTRVRRAVAGIARTFYGLEALPARRKDHYNCDDFEFRRTRKPSTIRIKRSYGLGYRRKGSSANVACEELPSRAAPTPWPLTDALPTPEPIPGNCQSTTAGSWNRRSGVGRISRCF